MNPLPSSQVFLVTGAVFFIIGVWRCTASALTPVRYNLWKTMFEMGLSMAVGGALLTAFPSFASLTTSLPERTLSLVWIAVMGILFGEYVVIPILRRLTRPAGARRIGGEQFTLTDETRMPGKGTFLYRVNARLDKLKRSELKHVVEFAIHAAIYQKNWPGFWHRANVQIRDNAHIVVYSEPPIWHQK